MTVMCPSQNRVARKYAFSSISNPVFYLKHVQFIFKPLLKLGNSPRMYKHIRYGSQKAGATVLLFPLLVKISVALYRVQCEVAADAVTALSRCRKFRRGRWFPTAGCGRCSLPSATCRGCMLPTASCRREAAADVACRRQPTADAGCRRQAATVAVAAADGGCRRCS